MLHVDIPTMPEILQLLSERHQASVSIYIQTTPETQHIDQATITLSNLAREADHQLEAAGVDSRARAAIAEQLEDMQEDPDFWKYQANSLAIFATPEMHRSYRLPNHLESMAQVSDRFHLKPLLRAISVQQHAFVLALSENSVRLVEVFADLPAAEIKLSGLPKDAASAAGTSTVNTRSHSSGRLHGSEGQKVLLRKFCRQIDSALRPLLAGRHEPLILAATEPLKSIYRSINSYPELTLSNIEASPERATESQLAEAARPILDERHADEIAGFKKLFSDRGNQGRATTDLAQAARAATFGAIDTLMVDIDEVISGRIDPNTGELHLADEDNADSYGVVDEIAARTLLNGGRVIGERRSAIPREQSLAAILRYAI